MRAAREVVCGVGPEVEPATGPAGPPGVGGPDVDPAAGPAGSSAQPGRR